MSSRKDKSKKAKEAELIMVDSSHDEGNLSMEGVKPDSEPEFPSEDFTDELEGETHFEKEQPVLEKPEIKTEIKQEVKKETKEDELKEAMLIEKAPLEKVDVDNKNIEKIKTIENLELTPLTTRKEGDGLQVLRGAFDEAKLNRKVATEGWNIPNEPKTGKSENKAGSIFYGLFSAFFELQKGKYSRSDIPPLPKGLLIFDYIDSAKKILESRDKRSDLGTILFAKVSYYIKISML